MPLGFALNDNLNGTAVISSTIQDPAGTYTATITVSDTQGLTDKRQAPIVVTNEDARVTYIGDSQLQEGSPVTIKAMVTEVADGSPGDITKANVFFDVTPPSNGTTSYGPVPVSVSGIATYTIPTVWL